MQGDGPLLGPPAGRDVLDCATKCTAAAGVADSETLRRTQTSAPLVRYRFCIW
jgi:hypothetical protein